MSTALSLCTLLVLVALWCGASAGPPIDPKFLLELASQFDTAQLTPSCRKVFNKCKARFVPLVMQFEQLMHIAPAILGVECIKRELAKGFPRFDIECVMSEDYKEGIDCMEDPQLLEILGQKAAKSLKPISNCFKDVPPPPA
ncbi:hypothetical protein HPB49_013617 [Dermacentor silvarum]|uniref:Uncharacterized protein n=1 Tax=Dermacentor silvarum TaxID=543639 RepID=A0ACB8DP19_DERSI|nr:uncharacterized protein LOC119431489 [Dermacentor silvarum]KAH7974277.1 hypothetical protein HPB49_013617 [Dermacentor silvarum]